MASHHEDQEQLTSGIHVYQNKRGQTVYWNPLTKQTYIITKDVARTHSYYSMRPVLGFIVGYFLMVLLEKPLLGITVGVLVWQVIAFFFYKKFLPTLPIDEHFVRPEKHSLLDRLSENLDANRLFEAALVALLLGTIITFNAWVNGYETLVLGFNIVFSLICYGFALLCFIAWFRKRKEGKK